MRGEHTPIRASGWLFIVPVAVLAVALLASAAAPAPPKTLVERLAAGESVSLSPRPLGIRPMQVVPASIGPVEYTVSMDNGWLIEGPLGAPDPRPTDAPFGTEVLVTADPDAQVHPSVAGEPNGAVLYAAYTDQVTPTNRDVIVARSTNGGATWTAVTVAGAAYNEFDPRVVVHGSRVFVFFSMDDAGLPRGFRYAVSTNQGQSFSVIPVNFGGSAPFRDLRNFDASSYNGQWLYTVYEANCDAGGPGTPPCFATAPAYVFITTMFDVNGAIVPPSIYFPFGVDTVQPSIIAGPAWTLWAGDIDAGDPLIGGPPGSHDVLWGRTPTGQNTAASWADFFFTGLFSTDVVRADSAAWGTNHLISYQYIDAAAGFPNHAVLRLYNNNDSNPVDWVLAILAAEAGVEVKDPAVFGSTPLFHATFFRGGDLGYAFSSDGSVTWSTLYKVNSNVGTVVDALRANDVTYAAKVRVCYQDNRGGNDIYCTGFSGFSFYIFDRSPRQGQLTLDGAPTNVPFAQLWATGEAHTVIAPTPDPVGVGTRLVFDQWSDGTLNPTYSITVGAVDVFLLANYKTQYWLTMSATVGGVTLLPGDSWHDAGATVTIECRMPAPGPDTRYAFLQWIGTGPGSITGPFNPVDIVMNGPIQEVCEAIQQFRFSVNTEPTGLQVTINGTTLIAPQNNLWWDAGSSNILTAISPQSPGSPLERYVFVQWSDGNPSATRTVIANAPGSFVAQYRLEYSVAIRPTPADCNYLVDGTTYTAGQTFWFAQGTTHAVDVPSPQARGVDTRYVFGSWSDGQPRSHNIVVTTPQTLDLICNVEYRYILDATPAGLNLVIDGTTLPAPQTLWWVQGSTHTAEFQTVTINPDTRRVFVQWSDGNTANPRTFASVAGPASLTATTALEYRYVLDTNPTGLTLLVDGVSRTTPYTDWWREGSTHTAEFRTVVQPDRQLVFTQWSDGNANNPRTFPNINAPGAFTAEVVAQYRFVLDTSPGGLTLRVDGTDCTAPCTFWWTHGTSHTAEFLTVTITADTRRAFADWSDGNTANPRTFGNVQEPATLTLRTQLEYRYQLDTSPSGLNLVVDGSTVTAPYTAWFAQGSTHQVSFPADQSVGPGARRQFLGWSDGNTANPRTFSGVSGPLTLTVTTYAEYQLTFDTSPPGIGVSITVDGAPATTPAVLWVREGSRTVVAPDPAPGPSADVRYVFLRWNDGNTQATRTLTVSAALTYTIQYQTQYRLTVDVGPDFAGHESCDAPDCWYDAGTTATVRVDVQWVARVATGAGTRAYATGWTGAVGSWNSATVTMDAAKTVTLVAKEQVLITVRVVDQAGAPLSGATVTVTAGGSTVNPDADGYWVDVGASVEVSVPAEFTSAGASYRFQTWTGGPATATNTFTASGPRTLTAEFRSVGLFESPFVWIGLILAILAAILVAWFLLRRRKQEPEQVPPAGPAAAPPTPPPPAPTAGEVPPPTGAEPTMACPSCGLTIPARAGPCPICGAEVAPPAVPAGDERIRKLEEAYRSGRISYEQYQANLKRIRGA